ncbi:MAG: riboflavin biosynthesis protein RibF [Pyramidobacter sp.]|nr:riboflavin biosynthesis protein RibF [Pyramidobacter sp.]
MIVCIGSFDGYHRGHFTLFCAARDLARAKGTEWEIVTFSPHPRFVLGKGLNARLFSEDEKKWLRNVFSIPQPIEIAFTHELASMEPGVFLDELGKRLGVTGIVVGKDFRFGRNRLGDSSFLVQYCSSRGWSLRLMPHISDDGDGVSSSRIRELVRGGDVEEAHKLLGYPYFILSEIVGGEQRGRTLGFPTANIVPSETKIIPMEGAYAGAALHAGHWYPAAVSVGRNPTFNVNGGLRIESHLIGFSGNLYGSQLTVAFLEKLRPLVRYGGKDELIAQLSCDCKNTESIFQRYSEELNALISCHKSSSVL